MADVTPLANGLYRVVDESGQQYDVPEHIAMSDYPEAFGTPEVDAGGLYDVPFAEAPPWETGGVYADSPAADAGAIQGYADDILADPQMEFSVEEADGGVQPMEFSYEEAGIEPGTNDWTPAPPQRQKIGGSIGASGTGPYREYDPRNPPPAPDQSGPMAAMLDAADRQRAAISMQQGATGEYAKRYAAIDEQMRAERELAAQKSQEMHEFAMARVAEDEERLAQRMSQMSRMDMNKVWKETPSGAKLSGVLAAGIAGWLNPTGKNSVVEQMMQIADQSAREQEANMALERFQYGQEASAMERRYARAENSRQAFLENRALILQGLRDTLAMEQSKYQSAITIGKLEQMKPEIDAALAKTIVDIRNTSYQQALSAWSTKAQLENEAANRRQRAAQFNKRLAFDQEQAALKASGGQTFDKGVGMFTLDNGQTVYMNPEIGAKAEDQARDIAKLVFTNRVVAKHSRKLFLMADELSKFDWDKLPGDTKAKWEARINSAISDMREELGANLTADEANRATATIGDITKWTVSGKGVQNAINEAISARNSRIDTALAQIGARTYENVELPDGRVGVVSTPYKRGSLQSYFGEEFSPVTLDAAVKADVSTLIDDVSAKRDRMEMIGSDSARAEYESAAKDLIEYAQRHGVTSDTMPESYGAILEAAKDVQSIDLQPTTPWGEPSKGTGEDALRAIGEGRDFEEEYSKRFRGYPMMEDFGK